MSEFTEVPERFLKEYLSSTKRIITSVKKLDNGYTMICFASQKDIGEGGLLLSEEQIIKFNIQDTLQPGIELEVIMLGDKKIHDIKALK